MPASRQRGRKRQAAPANASASILLPDGSLRSAGPAVKVTVVIVGNEFLPSCTMRQRDIGGFMSAVADRVLTVARPSPGSSDCMWIPLLGGLWVLANVGLAVLGIHINWPGTCSFVAGLINGTLLS